MSVAVTNGVTTTGDQPFVVEHGPRWTAADAFQFPISFPQPSPPRRHNPCFHQLHRQGLEKICVAPCQGKFLSIQCQIISAKHVLEIGTLGAYSTIWTASATPNTKVVTIEIDPAVAAIARENVR